MREWVIVAASIFASVVSVFVFHQFQKTTDGHKRKKYSAGWITTPDHETAAKILKSLLQEKLIACGNIVPNIESHYTWQGNQEKDVEVMLMIKTKSSLIPEVTQHVKSIHPFLVPEVITVELNEGNEEYYKWIDKNTK
eukprot:TRINITY_DN1404_c0_g2_i2.p1 TRINITY_DN1404_c0_g2~~TRINITY_DN1404_c0_g2_i2.p1  ORF type:complete len:150 (-),score=27.38 TRINITY_DN1404_c0_g2_i2:141-554(-)